MAPSIPKLLQGASGRPPTQPRGSPGTSALFGAFWGGAPSPQSPPRLHPKPAGQRKPQNHHRGINPDIPTLRLGSFWVTSSSQQGQGFSPQKTPRNEAWDHPALPGEKSKSRGIGARGAQLLGCSSSTRRACWAPRAHSAPVTFGCFSSSSRNQARPADFLPHKSHNDFIKMLLIVPKV